ncbi:MAG TPA: hypothetical protein VNM90_07645 [Haliangium sp.]|nr:hypothetical protein [Haliangium sp.]
MIPANENRVSSSFESTALDHDVFDMIIRAVMGFENLGWRQCNCTMHDSVGDCACGN